MPDLVRFLGNCPKNVSKDAKFAIRASATSQSAVALTYRAANDERWYMSSEDHPDLVRMVNEVKVRVGDQPNGPFYVNEFSQVIVPAGKDPEYYLAGTYDEPLVFEFEGQLLSGHPMGLDGRALKPGDPWEGPHPGIPYTLKTGGKDIYYDVDSRPNVTRRIFLSKDIGEDGATQVALQIRELKGFQGGRIYVNELREMFAPVSDSYPVRYIYLGPLDLEKGWFKRQH